MDDISFEVAFRGYDTAQVNELVALVGHAIGSDEANRKAQAMTAVRDAAFE